MDATRLTTPVLTCSTTHHGKQSARRASYKWCTDTAYTARSRPHSPRFLAALAIGAMIFLGPASSGAAWLHWTNPKFNSAVDESGYVQCAVDVMSPLRDLATIRVYGVSIRGGLSRIYTTKSVRGREGLEDSVLVDPGPGAHFWLTSVDAAGNECCVSPQVYIGPITAVPVGAAAVEGVTSYRVFDARGRLVRPMAAGIYFWERRYSSGRVETGKTVRVK
jgi:hypothetical protein